MTVFLNCMLSLNLINSGLGLRAFCLFFIGNVLKCPCLCVSSQSHRVELTSYACLLASHLQKLSIAVHKSMCQIVASPSAKFVCACLLTHLNLSFYNRVFFNHLIILSLLLMTIYTVGHNIKIQNGMKENNVLFQ